MNTMQKGLETGVGLSRCPMHLGSPLCPAAVTGQYRLNNSTGLLRPEPQALSTNTGVRSCRLTCAFCLERTGKPFA